MYHTQQSSEYSANPTIFALETNSSEQQQQQHKIKAENQKKTNQVIYFHAKLGFKYIAVSYFAFIRPLTSFFHVCDEIQCWQLFVVFLMVAV